jgi:hypothetical protein
MSEPGDQVSEAGVAPPPGWPDQRPVVDGVQEVSQDPELFAADEDPEVYDDDPADSEGGA